MSFELAYLKCTEATYEGIKKLGDRAMEQLNNEELNWSPNAESNSIAVIVRHLSGNMISRWTDFFITDGEKANRNRDMEFEGKFTSKEALIHNWNLGWQTVFDALDNLTEGDVLKTVYIRGEAHTVLQAIERQISHYAQHIGQIVYIAKQIKNEEWRTLSIPRGKSIEFMEKKLRENHRD